MAPRFINRMELSFWDYAIPALTKSALLRRTVYGFHKLGKKKSVVVIMVTIIAGGTLGLLTGIILRNVL
jgi:hypothetical protein